MYVSEAGLKIPEVGLAIDAHYEPQLDNLIPGYRILNIVLSNSSGQTLYLDPQKDEWIIVDLSGKKHKAINHLMFKDKETWQNLPLGLQKKLEYPQAVRSGNVTKIDVFFPIDVEINNFKEFFWESPAYDKKFNLIMVREKNLDIFKEDPLLKGKPSFEQSQIKYEGPPIEVEDDEKHERVNEPPKQFDPTLDDFTIEME